MKRLSLSTVIMVLLLSAGCEKDPKILSKAYPYVILDELSGIDGTGVTVNSEVISSGEYAYMDFGFVISAETPPEISDRRISMKSVQDTPDKMTLRIDNDLATYKQYYIRAYIQTDSLLVYSNERSFMSLGCMVPRIDHLSVTTGIPGTVVLIAGDYFSETPGHNTVRFGEGKATILQESRDTIVVQCPNTTSSGQVPVSVEVAGHTGFASTAFTLVHPWTPLADFPGGSRFWSSSFTVGNNGYVTLGLTGVSTYATKELWEFSNVTGQWRELPAFPGQERGEAVSFAIGNSGYVGLGLKSSKGSYDLLSDLWEYNTTTNDWTRKADFPGSTNLASIYPHFVIDNKLYLYSAHNSYELWTYDPGLDTWAQIPVDTRMRDLDLREGFSRGNTGYFIEISGGAYNLKKISLWQFDPVQNRIFKTDSAQTSSGYINRCSFLIGNKLFLSGGNYFLIEYDMESGLLFNHNHPAAYSSFNFSMVFNEKAVVNNIESPEILEFNTAAGVGRK
jgi:hypothetical protein